MHDRPENPSPNNNAPTQPWLGRIFAMAMIGFFVMVALGVGMIYYYQKSQPRPEPLPFAEPKNGAASF